MSTARISAIEYYLPDAVLTNEELAQRFPDWSAQKIEEKTGVPAFRQTTPGFFLDPG